MEGKKEESKGGRKIKGRRMEGKENEGEEKKEEGRQGDRRELRKDTREDKQAQRCKHKIESKEGRAEKVRKLEKQEAIMIKEISVTEKKGRKYFLKCGTETRTCNRYYLEENL